MHIVQYLQLFILVVFVCPLFFSLVPGAPLNLEGDTVGSNGILLSWSMPSNAKNIDGYVIR